MMKSQNKPSLVSSEKQMPRQRDHDEQKDRHNIMASSKAWNGLEKLAKKFGYRSRSQLIESIGREDILIVKAEEELTGDSLEDNDSTTLD